MTTYVLLLRGINVGGKNKMPMADLKRHLEEYGLANVSTYIQSGNVIAQSMLGAKALGEEIEALLTKKFKLDSESVKVLALSLNQFREVVKKKPKGFGEKPDEYHSDAIFLIGIDTDEAMPVFNPREGVDQVWPGDGVIYSQRLSAQRTKSRLGKIVGTKPYKSMTIRSWATTVKLLELLEAADAQG